MYTMSGRAKKTLSKLITSYLDSDNEGECLQKMSTNLNIQSEERDNEEGVTLQAKRGVEK